MQLRITLLKQTKLCMTMLLSSEIAAKQGVIFVHRTSYICMAIPWLISEEHVGLPLWV